MRSESISRIRIRVRDSSGNPFLPQKRLERIARRRLAGTPKKIKYMKKFTVTILDGGRTARETNPFQRDLDRSCINGDTPPPLLMESYKSSESMRRVFEIGAIGNLIFDHTKMIGLKVGSTQTAEMMPSGKIRIL